MTAMFKHHIRVAVTWVVLLSMLPFAARAYGRDFTLAAYNVENLFDLHRDKTEYEDYIPGGAAGWNRKMMLIKIAHTAAVLSDLHADIVALEEIESRTVFDLLIESLEKKGIDYPYSAISGQQNTAVRCAVASIFPIRSIKEIQVPAEGARNILKTVIDIDGRMLILYVNHWKSKTGPESKRLPYARALSADVQHLPGSADVVLAGDFNSDYNEFETFVNIERLNDTGGITGINHMLGTVDDGHMVDEERIQKQRGDKLHYNLWLELPPHQRWSTAFHGLRNSPDSIIISKGLFDAVGISYVDNSFDKFDPQYLFREGRIYRWQRTEHGKGRHLGKGYSDHLPVFAKFTTDPFQEARGGECFSEPPKEAKIAQLYGMNPGNCNLRLRDCVVIYRFGDHAVIKRKNGRAIYIYEAAAGLQLKGIYDLTVKHLNRYHGNMEINAVAGLEEKGRVDSLDDYCIKAGQKDLADPALRNEMVCSVTGDYRNGWLRYQDGRKIRLYFSDPALEPRGPASVSISNARINYHDHPEILIEHRDQITRLTAGNGFPQPGQ